MFRRTTVTPLGNYRNRIACIERQLEQGGQYIRRFSSVEFKPLSGSKKKALEAEKERLIKAQGKFTISGNAPIIKSEAAKKQVAFIERLRLLKAKREQQNKKPETVK